MLQNDLPYLELQLKSREDLLFEYRYASSDSPCLLPLSGSLLCTVYVDKFEL